MEHRRYQHQSASKVSSMVSMFLPGYHGCWSQKTSSNMRMRRITSRNLATNYDETGIERQTHVEQWCSQPRLNHGPEKDANMPRRSTIAYDLWLDHPRLGLWQPDKPSDSSSSPKSQGLRRDAAMHNQAGRPSLQAKGHCSVWR